MAVSYFISPEFDIYIISQSSSQAFDVTRSLDCSSSLGLFLPQFCTVKFDATESCADKPLRVKIVHDKPENRKLSQLAFEVVRGGRDAIFCVPQFNDLPGFELLAIRSNTFWESGTKLSVPNTFIELLGEAKTFRKFEFSSIDFESIRDFLKKGLNIEELNIIKTALVNSLPEDMLENLTMLKDLIFRTNAFTSIPENFFANNKQLREILLIENPIDILPERLLENLENLETFYYDNTPKAFEYDLEYLLKRNPKPTILSKKLFSTNTKLKHVLLEGNLDSSIPEDLFSHNPELEHIIIRSTKITAVPGDLLKNLKNLKSVNFSRSQITAIPDNFFADNVNVEKVDFSGNKISQVPTSMLNGLGPSLRYFYLEENPITFIPDDYFSHNVQLKDKIILVYT